MLTPLARAVAALTSAAAIAVVAMGFVGTADAAPGCTPGSYGSGGSISCTNPGTPGNPGGDGDGGGSTTPAADTCGLDQAAGKMSQYDNASGAYCSGKNICFDADLYAPLALPEGDKPKEDSVARVTLCGPLIGPPVVTRRFWSGQEEPPSLAEQAQTAVDNLDFTTPTVGVSPATRTLVNLDTWFWLDGVQTTVKAQAFTLVATATLRSMTVDPGDGSGAFRCDNVATTADEAAQSCTYQYRKASLRGGVSVGGKAAYKATVTTVYDLTFTQGGAPIPSIAGAPDTINGPAATTAVRVDEVQTVTRPNR